MTSNDPSPGWTASPSLSLRILIPGWSQWAGRDHERAGVFFGTFAAALGVGLFAWGSRPGALMLCLAFLVHVVSTADVIRTWAFPGFSRWVPSVTATFGLGVGCYLPTLTLASLIAWPAHSGEDASENYLVNRWSYRSNDPLTGDWVWYRRPDNQDHGLGRLVARSGQVVEWSTDRLRVDGQDLDWRPATNGDGPVDLAIEVPRGQLLVAPWHEDSPEPPSLGMRLLDRETVIGRPWAQIYPIRSRRLIW